MRSSVVDSSFTGCFVTSIDRWSCAELEKKTAAGQNDGVLIENEERCSVLDRKDSSVFLHASLKIFEPNDEGIEEGCGV